MRLRPPAAATAAVVTLLLAACGGGGGGDEGVASLEEGDGDQASTETTLSEEEIEEALLDWAACMRGHGLDVADPLVGDGGTRIIVGGGPSESADDAEAGGPPDRAAFEEAQEECGEPPAMGGSFSEEDRAEMQENALEFAACMRDSGVPDFPDPDFSDVGPGAGPERRERREDGGAGGGGPMIAGPFGEVDLGDPDVAAAYEECQDVLGLPDDVRGAPPVARSDG